MPSGTVRSPSGFYGIIGWSVRSEVESCRDRYAATWSSPSISTTSSRQVNYILFT